MSDLISSASYIYPVRNPTDVLEFKLFPDQMSESFGSHGGSNAHPSLPHHVTQRTGRKSPTFKYSVLIDSVEEWELRQTGEDSVTVAYDWIQRNVGPEVDEQTGSQIFILKAVGPPRKVTLDQVDVEIIAAWADGTPRRIRVGLSGEYFFPVLVDTSLFAKTKGNTKSAFKKAVKAMMDKQDKALSMTDDEAKRALAYFEARSQTDRSVHSVLPSMVLRPSDKVLRAIRSEDNTIIAKLKYIEKSSKKGSTRPKIRVPPGFKDRYWR